MPRFIPVMQRVLAGSAAAAAFVLAGCTDSTSSPNRAIAPDAASLSQSPDIMDQTGRHVFHTKQWFENDARQNPGDARPGSGGGGTNTGIYYHGGPVLQSETKVVAIYWATQPIYHNGPAAGTTGTGTEDGSLIGHFLRNLGPSSYFNINSTYTDAAGSHIANLVTYSGYWATADGAPSETDSKSDAQMVALLQAGFNSGALTYDANTLYAIFTAGKANLGGGFGTQYCAYHYHGTVNVGGAKTVLYAAMPYDAAYPGACTNGTKPPNGALEAGADAEVNTLAHEVEETTTDLMGNAWFDRRGYENADKCAWTWGATKTLSNGGVSNIVIGGKDFLVQQNWLNTGSGGCAKSY